MKRISQLIALVLAMAGMGSLFSDSAFTQSLNFVLDEDLVTHLDWGGEHHRIEGTTSHGFVRLHYLKFNSALLSSEVILAKNEIGALKSVEAMARESDAVVGINANFYDPASNNPIGFILDDDQILNTPFGDRATLAIEFFGDFHFLNPRITIQLQTSSKTEIIHGVNRSLYEHALIHYTSHYELPEEFFGDVNAAAIRDGRIFWTGTGSIPAFLRDDQSLQWLVGSDSAARIIDELEIAEHVVIDYEMEPERFLIRDAVQAGPMLLNEGYLTLLRSEGFSNNFIQQTAARSAIGMTGDGELILAVITSGNGSVGMGLDELAEYLRDLGVVDAMAMDGGGSSSLVFKQGSIWRNVGGTREVPVGLVFSER